jgi:dolichyl-phosphate-mannose--protein O-mannosyl transferase
MWTWYVIFHKLTLGIRYFYSKTSFLSNYIDVALSSIKALRALIHPRHHRSSAAALWEVIRERLEYEKRLRNPNFFGGDLEFLRQMNMSRWR